MNYNEKLQAVKLAAAKFPSTFGLRAFPGKLFRISLDNSYVNDADEVTLYLDVQVDGKWLTFGKGSTVELQQNYKLHDYGRI